MPAHRRLLLSLLIAAPCLAQPAAEEAARPLAAGAGIERDMKGGERHAYQIPLAAGQFLRAVFTQRGIDVVVKVIAPDGKQLAEVDSPNGLQGPEPVSVAAQSAGTYRLEVQALDKTAAPGKYEAKVEELLSAAQYAARLAEQKATLDAVKGWLLRAAVSLRTVEAGQGFADLSPLKKLIGPAQVVGLGEATHGTREFFQFKHRMLEFLVSEMGFTVLGMEASMPEGFDVNQYVLTGQGDPVRALAGLYFWTWDTQEVLELLKWMRQYNADPNHKRKVKFYGFDMQSAPRAARVMLAYLRKADAEQAAAAQKTLARVGNPMLDLAYDEETLEKKEAALAAAQAALKALDAHKTEYVKKTSAQEWALARQHAQVLAQNLEMRKGPNVPNAAALNVRDRAMAENVRWILAHEGAGTKMVLWGHNGHVSVRNTFGVEWMGSHLRKALGSALVLLGAAFNQGGFQAVETPGGKGPRPFNVGPAPEGSLDATLAAAGLQTAVVDLRALPKDGPVTKWFAAPRQSRSVGAVFSEAAADSFLPSYVMPQLYDALYFVEKTSSARPLFKSDASTAAPLAAPANLDFEEGEAGKAPAGWTVPPRMGRYDFACAASEERPSRGKRSALLSRTVDKYYGETLGSMTQRVAAAAYRGKRIRLRAMARAEAAGGDDQAYLRLRVTTPKGTAFDSLAAQPITAADWRAYTLEADVPAEADAISYGVYLVGKGRVWLDAVAVEVLSGK